jgi:hypothetical protein
VSKVIIYNQDTGFPAVLNPSPEAIALYGIEAIALKDVPAGKRFKIIDAADLPDAPQEAWQVSENDLTDGVGAESNEFPSTQANLEA